MKLEIELCILYPRSGYWIFWSRFANNKNNPNHVFTKLTEIDKYLIPTAIL